MSTELDDFDEEETPHEDVATFTSRMMDGTKAEST